VRITIQKAHGASHLKMRRLHLYLQVLADHKASLATLQAQKKVLDKETAERKEQLARFENDWTKANTDKTAAKKTLQRLQAEQQDT